MDVAESELIKRSRSNDGEAFATLVDRHKDKVVNYLARLTGCRERAEDVAQETFVRFYQALDRFRDEGNLSAFLFRVATNLVRTEERRKRRWRLLQPVLRSNGHAPPANEPRDRLLSHEIEHQVSLAIASLDLIYRAPLVMREIEGLPYRDIAIALETSEGTIKSRVHRGKRLLKQKLAPYWNGETSHV